MISISRTPFFLTVNTVKYMMKSGAPPDKFIVLHYLLPIEFHGSQAELISKGYHSLGPSLISIFI